MALRSFGSAWVDGSLLTTVQTAISELCELPWSED